MSFVFCFFSLQCIGQPLKKFCNLCSDKLSTVNDILLAVPAVFFFGGIKNMVVLNLATCLGLETVLMSIFQVSVLVSASFSFHEVSLTSLELSSLTYH